MAGQTNLQKDVLVLNMEHQLLEIAQNMFDKEIAELTDQELYYVVLVLTKRLMKVSDENEGEKKVFYISAEFLIGKLPVVIWQVLLHLQRIRSLMWEPIWRNPVHFRQPARGIR